MSVLAEIPRLALQSQRTFAALAPLFRYPDVLWTEHLGAARTAIDDESAAAERLRTFASETARLDFRDHQALYTSTFDLAPSCSPYLGAHRFGDESPERARLMVGLRIRYGGGEATELPDHIAEVFGFAESFYEEEWKDLRELVVKPSLEAMNAILSPTSNPYRHLLAAACALCEEPARGAR